MFIIVILALLIIVHKISPKLKDFYKTVLSDLSKIVEQNKLKVIGMSALCVSYSGVNLFYNILNFHERTDYLLDQHIFERQGKITIKNSQDINLQELESEGYKYVIRCKFLISCPKSFSLVWKYFSQCCTED